MVWACAVAAIVMKIFMVGKLAVYSKDVIIC